MAPPADPRLELHPMTMGELIDRSVRFWRLHMGPLFRLMLGFQLLQYAILKVSQLLISRYFPAARGGPATTAALQNDAGAALQEVLSANGLLWVTMLIYVAMSWVASVAVTHYALPRLLGETSTLEAAWRRATSRLGATLGAFALSVAWLCGLLVAAALPGATLLALAIVVVGEGGAAIGLAIGALLLTGVGALAAFLWYVYRFFLTAQVIAVEDVSATGALRRSGQLVSGHVGPGVGGWVWLRATLVITVMALVVTVVGLLAGLPALLLRMAYGNLLDPSAQQLDAVPEILLVPAELLQTLAQAAFGPIGVILAVVFYIDMRFRREGLDLELRLEGRKRAA